MASAPTAKPVPAANRAHAVSLIRRATQAGELAREVAESYGLGQAAERLAWALEFIEDAREQADAGNR